MTNARDKYLEPEERLALRTDDVYQTDKDVDTLNYSDRLLEIVATFSNSGQPEGWSIQSMVGRSKRGEVALRLFAVVESAAGESGVEGTPEGAGGAADESAAGSEVCTVDLSDPKLLSQWRFGPVGFKSRGCLAMTACASVICDMIEGLTFAEALRITPDQVKEAVGGVPWDKLHTTVFAVEAIRGLVGDWIIHQGATFSQLEVLLPCDALDSHCLMCEHCSLRAFRTDLRMDEILGQAKEATDVNANAGAGEAEIEHDIENELGNEDELENEDKVGNDGESGDEGRPGENAEDVSDLTPEMRELLENNALADLFDLVSDYSADSQLLTPVAWADLEVIPDFTTPEDFEMFVYEYLESYRTDHPLTREIHNKPAAEEASFPPDERTSAHGFRSATRAVGVAPSIREIMAAKRAAAEAEAEGSIEDSQPSKEAEEPEESEAPEVSAADVGNPSDANNSDSGDQKLGDETPDNPYAGLRLPKGYEMVQLADGEWAMAPIPADRIPDRREVHCENIVALTGQYTYYLYDRTKMTDSYAHWAFLAAENNPLVTFADLVREDSRTYPRPMAQKSLSNEPFAMDAEAVESAYEQALSTAGYEDIQRTEASNGDVYYFSTTYLTSRQAEALAEWASVERVANP